MLSISYWVCSSSYWDLLKCLYFARIPLKERIGGERRPQRQEERVTLWITLFYYFNLKMILDLTSRLFYVVLFCCGLWVLGISSGIWCGLYAFGQSKEGVKKFLFHLSKEHLLHHFIQIWTRSFKIILLKYIYIYIGLSMLYNQEKCSNNWTSIYEVCLFVCYVVISQTMVPLLPCSW
jgi:hypothetical protein